MLLSELFDQAHTRTTQEKDTFLFSGNPHQTVPRALLLDQRLTPLERNTWQIFHLLINPDGLTAFPTYEQLRPFLSAMPCDHKASTETIARSLTILRLTRWLTLARHRRNHKGHVLGNLYILHDDPLTPYESIQLDTEYLKLLSHALSHASKAIRLVACQTLKEITEDPMLKGCLLPSRLQMIAQRLASQGWMELDKSAKSPRSPQSLASESYPQAESEDTTPPCLRTPPPLPSESEVGSNPSKDDSLRNPKAYSTSTVLNTDIYKVLSTVQEEVTSSDTLHLPERFTLMKEEQQLGALTALQRVPDDLRQSVLNEWDARCQSGSIRNPAGYLFGIIQKALQGTFKAWTGHSIDLPVPVTPSPPPSDTPVPASRESALVHLANIRKLLRIR